MHFTFLANCVSTIVQNCSRYDSVWDLCFNRYTHVHLEQSSTMVKKNLQPWVVETEKGPHRSQWSKSKHSLEICVLVLKGNLFCLASGQMSQRNFALELIQCTLSLFNIANLASNKCPNLACHICGWTLLAETDKETQLEVDAESPFSSK